MPPRGKSGIKNLGHRNFKRLLHRSGEYVVCVNGKHENDERYAISSDAYLFGLYAAGLSTLKLIMTPSSMKFHGTTINRIGSEAKQDWEARFKEVICSSHLTRSDLCEALPASDLAKRKALPFY
jgi:hypothetical protein